MSVALSSAAEARDRSVYQGVGICRKVLLRILADLL